MFFLSIILSYLLGSVPTSYIMGKLWKGIDLRKHGSGNVGAANTFRVLGPIPGVIIFLGDALKGWVAVYCISLLVPVETFTSDWIKIFCGMAAICGHNWTIFLKFKGGRGVATSIGVFFALAWQAIGISLLLGIVIISLTRYISLGSMAGAIALPFLVVLLPFKKPLPYLWFALLVAFLVIIKHIPNIKRLIKGKENRFSFRRSKE
ncbi:glycerol-3-phosphate 1-O-acyltransferase PlsY [bacterium]|nr:glycerol-3-phosphate 1-O-acyltransferase PlsY [bacterium]MCG2676868.1 glycerol-3-phosphate 1-O-acyltransferase PlsY [bacterium]